MIRGRTLELISMIRAIGTAKGSIGVGVDAPLAFPGSKHSDQFGVDGATAAIKTVLEKCKL